MTQRDSIFISKTVVFTKFLEKSNISCEVGHSARLAPQRHFLSRENPIAIFMNKCYSVDSSARSMPIYKFPEYNNNFYLLRRQDNGGRCKR